MKKSTFFDGNKLERIIPIYIRSVFAVFVIIIIMIIVMGFMNDGGEDENDGSYVLPDYPVEVEGNLQALRSVDVNATQILQQSNMEEKAQKELSTYTLTDSDRATLERMQELLNKFISGEINLNEKDLAEIERVINSYRN